MSVSTFSFSFWMPCSACTERRRPSKRERTGDDADGRARRCCLAISAIDRRAAGAGAAALARGDEHHVGALQHLFDLVAVLLGGLAADLGIAARRRGHA